MTSKDRAWAGRHQPRGGSASLSRQHGIERGSYAQVVATNHQDNLLTERKSTGEQISYDPSRLRGISAYREIEREFAIGDRIQWTAPNWELGVASRDLGTIQQIGADGTITVRMDGSKERIVTFDPRVIDTNVHPELVNSRFAYVSVSRASHDAQIFTNDAGMLAENLSREVSKTSAIALMNHQSTLPSGAIRRTKTIAQIGHRGLGLFL